MEREIGKGSRRGQRHSQVSAVAAPHSSPPADVLMQLHVHLAARILAGASDTLLYHGHLAVGAHVLWKLAHADDSLHYPGPARTQLAQPSCILPRLAEALQSRRQRPQHGSDLNLIRPLESIGAQAKHGTLFEQSVRLDALVLCHGRHQTLAVPRRTQRLSFSMCQRAQPNVEA